MPCLRQVALLAALAFSSPALAIIPGRHYVQRIPNLDSIASSVLRGPEGVRVKVGRQVTGLEGRIGRLTTAIARVKASRVLSTRSFRGMEREDVLAVWKTVNEQISTNMRAPDFQLIPFIRPPNRPSQLTAAEKERAGRLLSRNIRDNANLGRVHQALEAVPLTTDTAPAQDATTLGEALRFDLETARLNQRDVKAQIDRRVGW